MRARNGGGGGRGGGGRGAEKKEELEAGKGAGRPGPAARSTGRGGWGRCTHQSEPQASKTSAAARRTTLHEAPCRGYPCHARMGFSQGGLAGFNLFVVFSSKRSQAPCRGYPRHVRMPFPRRPTFLYCRRLHSTPPCLLPHQRNAVNRITPRLLRFGLRRLGLGRRV